MTEIPKDTWRSQRSIDAEVALETKNYWAERFEHWMAQADSGEISRDEAIRSFREEKMATVVLDKVVES